MLCQYTHANRYAIEYINLLLRLQYSNWLRLCPKVDEHTHIICKPNEVNAMACNEFLKVTELF